MFTLNRLQLLFSAYAVLLCVSVYEFVQDMFITHNFLLSSIHQYTNPVQWAMCPFAMIIGFLLAKELEV